LMTKYNCVISITVIVRNCQLQFDGCVISDAPFVKNLGVHFDKALNMEKHVSVLVKSCFAQIRKHQSNRPTV
jgi:hypothetical protein